MRKIAEYSFYKEVLIYRLEQIQQTENELVQSRISIMLSQIQPYFLFNTITSIKQLCNTDPQKASDALEHFSSFLRENVDSLSNPELIHFERELKKANHKSL